MEEGGMVTAFSAGAVGEPGERTFLLQFHGRAGVSSYLLEKGQVAALSMQARDLLDRVGFGGSGATIDLRPLEEPEELRFRVGEIQLTYAEDTGEVTIMLVSVAEDDRVQYTLTPAMLDAAAGGAAEAVTAGRPPCPRCGLAMDTEGHSCPTNNGDLREHRP